MSDLSWLASHPANRFAAKCLRTLGVQPEAEPQVVPLVQLVREWFRRAQPGDLPWPEYQTELRERAEDLAAGDQVWATSLMAPEFETLQDEAEKLPEGRARYNLLADQLDNLLADLKRKPNVRAMGQVLAENLYSNLRQAYPAFGHLSESQ